MQKLLLKSLDIYTPVSKTTHVKNEDFDVDNFLHFPLLLNSDGSLWKHGNLYILSKLKAYILPSPKTLDSIANDLRGFKQWCDDNDVDYLKAPRKILRPTYLYRSHLQELLRDGKISPNSVKRKMSAVVGFYKYLMDSEGVEFKFPLWQSGITSISYNNQYGISQIKQVETVDVSKVVSTPNPDLFDDSIMDGGKLHPLTKDEQISILKALKSIGNTEMTLGFLIALTTGARLQTVYTLRLMQFSRESSPEEKEVKIKVGMGTHCDTKYDKQHILFVPAWLYKKIQVYINSPRAKSRRNKAKHIFDSNDLQYAFLTKTGQPFYCANNDKYKMLYRNAPHGTAIRQFISISLKKELQKIGHIFNFSFHDLRATFGMNIIDSRIHLVKSGEIELSHLLMYVKERMGHSSLTTTEKYLNFRDKHKIKEQVQDDFEAYMYGMLDE